MLTITDLLDDEKVRYIAKNEENLSEEDMAILYKLGITGMFSNEKISIPASILLKYTENHSFNINYGDGKFFLRRDVSDISEDIINMFIKSYTKKWIDAYLERNGGGAAYYLPEKACSYMVEDLEKMQDMGVKLTAANIAELMNRKACIEFYQEGRDALERILSKM